MDFWRKYFEFSKSELIGVLSLFIVILGLFSLRFIDLNFIKKTDFKNQKKEISEFINSIKPKKKVLFEESHWSKTDKKEYNLSPFAFDPNTMKTEDWEKLGLRPKQIASIQKYLTRGGKFYSKQDFSKMYCISKKEFAQLEPYIEIKKFEGKQTYKKALPQIFQIDLNASSQEDLLSIPGIGPAFASKIIKYRTILGGYYSVNQLKEVFGMDSLRFEQINPYFDIETDSIKKINLNSAAFKDLIRHPYISKTTAYTIIDFRQKHGNFNKITDLKKVERMTDTLYQKISPYFKLN